MSETKLSAEIQGALERVPGVLSVTRIQSGLLQVRGGWLHCAPNGTPDLMVLQTKGRVCFVEVKTDAGQVSEDQAAWIVRHEKHGHRVIVARSVRDAIDGIIGRKVAP